MEVRRGDFVIVRTGQMEQRLADKEWGGYAGGDAPGLAFETCDWIFAKEIAAICSDTWGIEVRPNETDEANQPFYWVSIPTLGVNPRRDFLPQRARRRLRGRWRVRIFLLCAAAEYHQGHGVADQPKRNQVIVHTGGVMPPGLSENQETRQ